MIVLFTDFGLEGPYVGQLKRVLVQQAKGVPIIDLFHNAPCFNPESAGHLLAAYAADFPKGTLFLCVVDPGVGSERRPVALFVDQKWFVGPDNGIFSVISARATSTQWWQIHWQPNKLSASFHGRDLFAPMVAYLACGGSARQRMEKISVIHDATKAEDLHKILYLDHYGNAITGLRANQIQHSARLAFGKYQLNWARVFSEVPKGQSFWYKNANDLVEIAVNAGSAQQELGLSVGDTFFVTS